MTCASGAIESLSARTQHQLGEVAGKVAGCQQFLADRLQELDAFDRRSAQLSQRLYLEVLRTRMRPFSDGVRRFPRMVRDLARALGKEVRLEIIGQNTQVDRDILERLETPLAHLLRNAVDHGCETVEQRRQAGKPANAPLASKRATAPACCWSRSPTTAPASNGLVRDIICNGI